MQLYNFLTFLVNICCCCYLSQDLLAVEVLSCFTNSFTLIKVLIVLSCETHSSLYGVNAYFNYITAHVLEALSSSIQEFFKVIHSRLLPSFLVSAFASLEFRVFFP